VRISRFCPECRAFIWSTMLKPRYYDKGVDAYWLDGTHRD